MTEIEHGYQRDAAALSPARPVEWRHLRYFQAVAEDLSYARAARRIRVAQPALSRSIQELEELLGATLLERSRHYVRLTPAGAVLLREVGVLLERLEETFRRVRRTAEGAEGELRLGYIGPPTQPFLGRLLAEYRRRYPLVTIHLEERTPERVWEMVSKGRLTLGITRPVAAHESLGMKTITLRQEPLGVVVPAGHPWAGRQFVPWKALSRERLVVLARREGMSLYDSVLASCRQAGFSPRLAHTPSLIGTVLSYVEAGAGLGVVTDSAARPSARLRFMGLRPVQTVPLVLVWQEDEDPPSAQRFRELLLEWRSKKELWGSSARRETARAAGGRQLLADGN